jgi:hypothetical protein
LSAKDAIDRASSTKVMIRVRFIIFLSSKPRHY